MSDSAMTYEEAVAQVMGPGGRFELGTAEVGGVEMPVFTHAPPSLGAIFSTWAGRGDALFLVYEDERLSFAEVAARVGGLGAALVDRYGVGPGDRVAIAMRNLPEWVVAFAAITSVGAVAVSLNGWWTADELEYGLEDSGARVLVADPERVARTRDAAARLDVATIGVRLPAGDHPEGVDRWEDVVDPSLPLPPVDVAPDDDATILYTSGTTGRPKGAVSTHRAVVHAVMSFGARAAVQRLRRPEEAEAAAALPPCFILVVPLFHVTGGVAVMLTCAASGTKLVMMHKWSPERALELIEREQVTNFVGVPTQSWDLMESPEFAARDTSSLVSVGGGGAPSPPALVARVADGFARGRPSIGYGMTETNAFGPQNSGVDYVSHPTSTGRSLPTLLVEVRDPDGVEVPTGEQGEIWFKGPSLIRGYWNRPEATAEALVDGWLRTGDVGRVDEDGFVYVEDRAKDLVLRAGENVSCAEVEAAVYEHPAVYEAAVFGVPHERLGEEVAVAVLPKEGLPLDADELRAHVADRLAAFKVPSRVVVVGERLPRNAAGKILKRELRDQVAASG
ncbi:class I adenylate-forming enzyme family protein [Iamia majanohamensis]|uniref:Class I adenylate-forming enzyme family protein n=1 Tax=Iamia majanohamensis TaxID=467976 RepID=A0AAE9Y3T5_9ACTN|nr:class I adenylate-forming enzyme family protein [Iamia majanohamensis]WCO66020.1 class I adenylate-forming enzyme family protein [Iamia majanohamensis]